MVFALASIGFLPIITLQCNTEEDEWKVKFFLKVPKITILVPKPF